MPNEVQRLIRKMQPAGPRSFDEHVWPIYVAIVVLFGYLVGVVVSLLNFNDARVHANAFTWLLALTGVGLGGLFCVRFLRQRLLKRTVVLSLLLSLIVNISLLIAMAWTSILSQPWQEPETEVAVQQQQQEIIVPEYPLFNEDPRQRVPQEFERPVETGEPQAEERIELTRQSTLPAPELVDRPPTPIASSHQQTQRPSTSQRYETPTAPRQSSAMSALSRQTLRSQLSANSRSTAIPTPPTTATVDSEQVTSTSVATSKVPSAVDRPPTTETTDQSSNRAPVTDLARKAETTPEAATVPSLPRLARRVNRPQRTPTTQTPIASRDALPQRTPREAPTPANTVTQKQSTTSAPAELRSVELRPQVATKMDRQIEIDQPETETLTRQIDRIAMVKQAAPASTATSTTPMPGAQIAAQSAVEVAKSTTAEMIKRAERPQDANDGEQVQPRDSAVQITSSTLARAQAESQPSVSETLADSTSPTRSPNLATQPQQTQTEVDAAISADSNRLTPAARPEPSRIALSRSSIGVTGVGDASNLERGAAAPDSPIEIASASANRNEATQQMKEAFALTPTIRSPTRQMRATANQPRASLQAQPIDSAMVPGATAPAEVASSSAATMERSPSNARQASVTASQGTTEVDLGPTRIAADTGSGRAEGGGQPELSSGELPRALSRANSIAGAAGSTTAVQAVSGSPAAQDLASEADTAGEAAANATEVGVSQQQADNSEGGGGNRTPNVLADATPVISPAAGSRADADTIVPMSELAVGGNRTPGRRARGMQLKSDTVSSVPKIASADSSSGSSRGDPLDAQGTKPRQAALGVPVPRSDDEPGAEQADLVLDGNARGIDTPIFSRKDNAREDGQSERMLAQTDRGSPARQRRAQLAGGSTEIELDPEDFAINAPSTGTDDGLNAEGDASPLSATVERLAGGAGSIPVEIEAPDGAGGLGDLLASDAGILSRSASPESEFVGLQPARFLTRSRASASIASSTDVVSPTKAFRRRIVRRGNELAGERGLPSRKTEAAIELGLVFLSRYQSDDGSWSFNNFADGKTTLPSDETAVIVSDTGATGLSLLSFLGAGYDHKTDKYQETVKNGIDFLVQHQRDDGDLYIDQDPNSSRSAWLYSHAIATIALCEAYGMTQDPRLRGPAQKAVNFIAESQHPTRGGWRYSPAYGADTSVTGWMTMALKSGELAGLAVDKTAFTKIQHWMELAQASDAQPYLFRYNPYAADTPTQRHGLKPTRAITAVGLLMRLYTGWSRDDSRMQQGAETLAQNLPEIGTTDQPRRDTYYWYYATQVMYHMGGDYWEKWNQALHPMLTRSQTQSGPLAGSWDPQIPVPDRWGTYGGRLYLTTMNLLSLEVFYRHLPIYEDTAP